jgi:hypothetical protein
MAFSSIDLNAALFIFVAIMPMRFAQHEEALAFYSLAVVFSHPRVELYFGGSPIHLNGKAHSEGERREGYWKRLAVVRAAAWG